MTSALKNEKSTLMSETGDQDQTFSMQEISNVTCCTEMVQPSDECSDLLCQLGTCKGSASVTRTGVHFDTCSILDQDSCQPSLKCKTEEYIVPTEETSNQSAMDLESAKMDALLYSQMENAENMLGNEERSYFIQVDASTVVSLQAGTQYTLVPIASESTQPNGQDCICVIQDSGENRNPLDKLKQNVELQKQKDKPKPVEHVVTPETKKENIWMDCSALQPEQFSLCETSCTQPQEPSGAGDMQFQPSTYTELENASPISPPVPVSWDVPGCNSIPSYPPPLVPPAHTGSSSVLPHSFSQKPYAVNSHTSHVGPWSNSPWSPYTQNHGYAPLNSLPNPAEENRLNEYQGQNQSNFHMNGNDEARMHSYQSTHYQDNVRCYVPYNGRENHNEKERKRRTRIKMACQSLRSLVPGLTDKTDKATVFEITVQYLAHLKQNTPTNIDKDFVERFASY